MSDKRIKRISMKNLPPYQCCYFHSISGVEAHSHNLLEFDFFPEGYCHHVLNGKQFTVTSGTLIMVSYADVHSYLPVPESSSCSAYSAHCEEGFLDDAIINLFHRMSGCQITCKTVEEIQEFEHEFSLLNREINQSTETPDAQEFIRNIFTRLILMAFRLYSQNLVTRGLGIKETRPEIAYIDRYFQHPLSLDEVASVAGLSRFYFSKIFRERYGVSFHDYIQEKRLQWAYNLIKSTNMSISKIAEEAGFNSHNYFNQRFKKRFGIVPGQLRKMQREIHEVSCPEPPLSGPSSDGLPPVP